MVVSDECTQVFRDMTGVIAFKILAYSPCDASASEIRAPNDSIITIAFNFVRLSLYDENQYVEVAFIKNLYNL